VAISEKDHDRDQRFRTKLKNSHPMKFKMFFTKLTSPGRPCQSKLNFDQINQGPQKNLLSILFLALILI